MRILLPSKKGNGPLYSVIGRPTHLNGSVPWLGSSGSFTVGLVKALYNHRKTHINQKDIAKLACEIEINKLNQPIGKQDQYASAIGGLTCFNFKKNDSVTIAPLLISNDTLFHLEDRLLLFFTGFSRSANDILDIQKKHTEANNEEMIKIH